jgi:hypothetical protein
MTMAITLRVALTLIPTLNVMLAMTMTKTTPHNP